MFAEKIYQSDEAQSEPLLSLNSSETSVITEDDVESGLRKDKEAVVGIETDVDLPFGSVFLTMMVGLGASWLLLDSLWVELPYFQQYSPAGLQLANQMTMTGSVAGILIVPIYLSIDRGWKINYRALIYVLILLQAAACGVVACLYDIVAFDMSLVVLCATFVAQFCACVQGVVIQAYFTFVNEKLNAPLWVGANLGSLCAAITGMIQQPGAATPLFSPLEYFLSWIPLYIASFIAFYLLDRNYLAEHDHTKETTPSSNEFGVPYWWKAIWKYVALYSLITLVTWVFVRAAIPYSVLATSTDSSDNTQTEQWVITISLVGVVLGSAIALWVQVDNDQHIWNLSLFYIILLVLFFWIAFDKTGLWKWDGANILVVVIVFFMRLTDGFLSPVMYSNIQTRYPEVGFRMNQWMGVVSTFSMFVGVWLSFFVLE